MITAYYDHREPVGAGYSHEFNHVSDERHIPFNFNDWVVILSQEEYDELRDSAENDFWYNREELWF